eukprot:1157506-Pelagomonas_calceolata.AAC.3
MPGCTPGHAAMRQPMRSTTRESCDAARCSLSDSMTGSLHACLILMALCEAQALKKAIQTAELRAVEAIEK